MSKLNSQLVELLRSDDDRMLTGERHEAAVVIPEGVLHAGDLAEEEEDSASSRQTSASHS